MSIEHVSAIWPQARKHLGRALALDKAGRYELSDILGFILKGTVRLWVSWNAEARAVEAAMITEIVEYPRLKELRIWLVGGRNMKAWGTEARDLFERFAKESGCALVTGQMRRGWLRIGGPGYYETGITFEKRI